MASRISEETLREAIQKVLAASQEKKRNFVETIDLQIGLRNYDPRRDVKFNQTLRLPYNPRPRRKVCVIGDEVHYEEATRLGIPSTTMTKLADFKKDRKLLKHFISQYDAFLITDSLLKMVPRVFGPALTRAGKFPATISRGDDLKAKVEEQQCTIRFQLKKVICLGTAVANVSMTEDQIYRNLSLAINCLVSLLKKKWQSVGSLYISSTMGPGVRIF